MTDYRKKLIEVALPLEAINAASAREKSIRHGHPSTLHLWWARRPLAACRAVLFGQLVDDPSAWPELFPTEKEQDEERQRLFRIIEQMVTWENTNNETVINAARLEIARSVARNRKADGDGNHRDDEVLADGVVPKVVNAYLAEFAPPVHDPFAGGGSIPLEAQRLGLRAVATDLNPVAVLINKALIEIPPKFAGMPPVNPESRRKAGMRNWKGVQGLAEDVRYYGRWMRDEAYKRIGHLYPEVEITPEMTEVRPDLKPVVGQKLMVIAWLWARTVVSPNPAMGGVHVPLVSSFWLGKKKGKEAWLEPVVDVVARSWRFTVRTGAPKDANTVGAGTKTGRGDFQCLLSGDPIPAAYVRAEGQAGRLRDRLMAVVTLGQGSRIYLSPEPKLEQVARVAVPDGAPDTNLPEQALGFRVQNYGIKQHRDLFTSRQLTALVTFSDLVGEARDRVLVHVQEARGTTGTSSPTGGWDGEEYAKAVATNVAFAIGRTADFGATLCVWSPAPKNEVAMHVFGRQTLSMNADFAEVNPFSNSSGNWLGAIDWVAKAIAPLPANGSGTAYQEDAASPSGGVVGGVVSTDPPYFDNVPYADLSDYFYVWLRRALRPVHPTLFQTVLVPKADELVAEPFRHGGKQEAETFFMSGMMKVASRIAVSLPAAYPTTIYYAFKQSEAKGDGTSSTGWEAFLEAVGASGLSVVGTWPVRTERSGRLRDTGSNALASSIVLVCRKRQGGSSSITRSEFRRQLREELPPALKALQKGNIAPVDMAQASIGPGMAIFSRHSKVIEADGSAMPVRTALQMINEALDDYLAEQTGEFGPDTRFAVTWFETRGFEAGPFGDAETLAKARNVSVEGVQQAGILHSAAGKVRLLKRDELPDEWDPATDPRLTVWEATQHLIKRLENQGEQAAADLLAQLGSKAEPARDLAYRLYTTCERKKWADEARAYNGLVVAWPELARLAVPTRTTTGPAQADLFGE